MTVAQIDDVVFDNSMVKLKRALAITTCAMVAAKDNEWFDHRPEIEYALWQVQENLCDVVLDFEEEIEFNEAFGSADRANALDEAARLVERFNDSPVVVPPNESFATVIAKAIRQLATK
jgi:hypothetical protein